MAVADLSRAAMAAPVVGNHAVVLAEEIKQLCVPVICAQWPTVMKDERLRIFRAPIFVEDLHTAGCGERAAVREMGHNYRQVAKWLTRERIPAQRAGQWKAQSVKNLVVRYWGLTGRRILIPYKKFPTPAHRHRWA